MWDKKKSQRKCKVVYFDCVLEDVLWFPFDTHDSWDDTYALI